MNYDEIVDNVNEILLEYDMPLTLRQIYYRLVADFGFENTVNNYKGLSRKLVKAREQGDVDESRMEDRVRQTIGSDFGYSSPQDFLDTQIKRLEKISKHYSRPMWNDQDYYIEIWIEKDALSRIVSDEATKFNVLTAVARGYSSYTFIRDGVQRILENAVDKKPVILNFTDFDPSGLDMSRDLKDRLRRYGAVDVIVERIALTKTQVIDMQLPPAPSKKSDSRAKSFIEQYGDGVVELDAIKPNILQKIVRSSILEYIDIDRWNEKVELIGEERSDLKERIEGLMDVIRDEWGIED